MRIETFEFTDHETGWHLKEARFDGLNLLVGISGVGKSKVLRALDDVRKLGLGEKVEAGHWSWRLTGREDGRAFVWSCTVAMASGGHVFDAESVVVEGEIIVEREGAEVRFKGTTLPRLNPTECALVLLSGEDDVSLVRRSLTAFVNVDRDTFDALVVPGDQLDDIELIDEVELEGYRASLPGVQVMADGPLSFALFILQAGAPRVFGTIRDAFLEVFPSVSDLRIATVGRQTNPQPHQRVEVQLREYGSETWIRHRDISTGMLRVLGVIRSLLLMRAGSVLCIDEFENSLGVNCLPAVTGLINARADCQFILTSHHPYVIEHIPLDVWKLVRRRGSTVELLPARDIPSLADESHLDAFTRLINTPEYEAGID